MKRLAAVATFVAALAAARPGRRRVALVG